jgi:chitosanase
MELTALQEKSIKAILNIFETGSIVGQYDSLVTLPDGAGITFGKTQTTENGGGLYDLLKQYFNISDSKYAKMLQERFLSRLYDGKDKSKKGTLTNDVDFKQLLCLAARNDRKMRVAQDQFFHNAYFLPAIRLCDEYDLNLPLSIAIIYDSCVHSGLSGASKHVDKYDDVVDLDYMEDGTEEEMEAEWSNGYIEYRHAWLSNFRSGSSKKQKIVRKTVYRTIALKALADTSNWMLDLPFDVKLPSKLIKVTEKLLEDVR